MRVKPGEQVQIGLGRPYTVSESATCPVCGRWAMCKPHRFVWAEWLNAFRAAYAGEPVEGVQGNLV